MIYFNKPIDLYPALKAASRHFSIVFGPLILKVPTEIDEKKRRK
jgi:hypothetical protein